jgi:hypothetical protein
MDGSRTARRGGRGVLATFATFGALLAAETSAHAFCREVTETPPSGFDPAQEGCFTAGADGGVLPPLFWRNQCVSYSLQRGASTQVSLGDAQRIAGQAFAAWTTVSCPGGGSPSIVATAYPVVDCDQVPSQGHNNVIIFRDDGWPYDDSANAIGYTTLTIHLSTGEIVGADIEINSANFTIVASGTPPAGAYDLASILTHEAGHFLGLAHSADTNAVMYAFYHPGSTTPQPDDVGGICSIYSPDGSRMAETGPVAATSCQPEPAFGFETECGSLDSGTESMANSGGTANDAGDGGDAGPDGDTLFGCAVGSAPGSGPTSGAACSLAALVAIGLRTSRLRRRRRARRPSRLGRSTAAAVVGFVIAATALARTGGGRAEASVSIPVVFDDLVRRSSAVAIVVPSAQRAVWEDGRIVTYTRMRIDRLVAGRLEGEVWVRSLGGAVGDIAQIVEGQPRFAMGVSSLVFLRPHLDPVDRSQRSGSLSVVASAQGQFPIVTREGQPPRLALALDVGGLVPSAEGGAPRLARDALKDQAVESAVREIAATWPRAHRDEVSP